MINLFGKIGFVAEFDILILKILIKKTVVILTFVCGVVEVMWMFLLDSLKNGN
jgi:hypothetical protein